MHKEIKINVGHIAGVDDEELFTVEMAGVASYEYHDSNMKSSFFKKTIDKIKSRASVGETEALIFDMDKREILAFQGPSKYDYKLSKTCIELCAKLSNLGFGISYNETDEGLKVMATWSTIWPPRDSE